MVADRCIISNNTLKNTNSCFIYVKSSNNKIINNSISHSLTRQGICLRNPSHDNIVRGNRISDCETGILTWGSGNNLIEGNVVQNCISFGLDIGNDDNVIRYNTIENNTIGIQLMSVRTTVSNNNFINNEKYHATAYNSRFSWLISNKWIGNYWDRGRILPYPILSQFFIFPWVLFDWHPAQEPYDIPRMT
jgi:parallel beta-helix repeat protein